jgi:hypothetical protein
MAGTIVTDRIESDASYASSITVASPLVVSNTISLGSAAAITGNVNIDSGTLFVDSVNNRVGVGLSNPESALDVRAPTSILRMQSTTGTNSVYQRLTNDGGQLYFGIDNSSGNDLITGSSAHAGILVAPGSTRSLHLGTNGAARLSIDSAGRVTMPAQPSFLAQVDGGQSFSVGWNLVTIRTHTSTFDNGNNVNYTTERFTAPIAGKYLFSAAVTINGSNTDGTITLYKNGSDVNCGASQAFGSNLASSNLTYVLNLAANDYIQVYYYASGSVTTRDTNFAGYFSGYLIG